MLCAAGTGGNVSGFYGGPWDKLRRNFMVHYTDRLALRELELDDRYSLYYLFSQKFVTMYEAHLQKPYRV